MKRRKTTKYAYASTYNFEVLVYFITFITQHLKEKLYFLSSYLTKQPLVTLVGKVNDATNYQICGVDITLNSLQHYTDLTHSSTLLII